MGLASSNVAAAREDDCDEVHTVAVSTLGCRTADPTRGVDAKLMSFDEPLVDVTDLVEQRSNSGDQFSPHGRGDYLGLDGLELALDATVKRVVRSRLPVRTPRDGV